MSEYQLFLRACARLPRLLWVAACLACFANACTRATTETGNPPVIDLARVALHESGGRVHVIGKAAAVTPPQGQVEIKNLTHAAAASAGVAANGSFDVTIKGTLDDEYTLVVRSGMNVSATVKVTQSGAVLLDAGTLDDAAAPADSGLVAADGGEVDCTATFEKLSALWHDETSKADTACTKDSDCVLATEAPSCDVTCDQGFVVSKTGQQQLADAAKRYTDGLCANVEQSNCVQPIPPCLPPAPSMISCVAGTCRKAAECLSCAAACSLPFDSGTTAAGGAVGVYFHEVVSGACVPRTYNGQGGNANRFATRALCETSCPPPAACPDGRVNTSLCLECGPAGGCGDQRDVCAQACATAADCDSDPLSMGPSPCNQGVCTVVTGCL